MVLAPAAAIFVVVLATNVLGDAFVDRLDPARRTIRDVERLRVGRAAQARLGWEAWGLALLAVLPFLNGLAADFTYDDKLIIRDDAADRLARAALAEIFTTQYFGGSLATAGRRTGR